MRICLVLSTFLLMLVVACASTTPLPLERYRTAVNAGERLPEAVARDAWRRPFEVLQFAGVREGDRIAEIAPGGGYYTAILSRVVGDRGEVIAVDPERLFKVFPRGREGFPRYAAADPRDNVTYSTQHLDEIELPDDIDQVWMVLYYHDTLWTGEDRAAMNARFFNALKPGGSYLVLDHHALAGAPESVGQEFHRMDRAIAVEEILAAGFELAEESDVLRNAEDPRDDSVFAEHRRGQTDRFLIRFTRPNAVAH